MRNYLSMNWNIGLASGELISTLILIFISFSLVLHFKNNKYLKIMAFVFAGLFGMTVGWGLGSLLSGRGSGLSLISPITAILMSFHYNAYNALWFIILFQFIGSSLGFCMYLIYKKFLFTPFTKNKKDNILKPNLNQTVVKSVLFQPFLLIAMLLIPILEVTAYGTSTIWNSIILIVAISSLFLVTKNVNSLIFSPFFTFYKLMDLLIDKKLTKENVYSFLIEILIQIFFIIIIINLDVAILKYRKVY